MSSGAAAERAAATGPRILIVDDDRRILELLEIAFTAHGFRVLTAPDGEEATKLTLAERPDLVVLDVRLPKKSGLEVCEWLRKDPDDPLVPILMLLFGLGRGSIVAVAFVFAFFVITVNVNAAVKHVDPRLIQMARSFGAGEWALVRRVIVPAALPLALAGMRMGIGRAVNGAVLGEMLISSVGIGGLMMYYGGAFRVDFLYGLLLMVVALAGILMGIVHAMEKRALRWMR